MATCTIQSPIVSARLAPFARVHDVTTKNFGLVIGYVIPGFIALYGGGYLSPVIRGWLASTPDIPGSVESLFFVSVASVGAGMTLSAFRFVLVDTLHHRFGLQRPMWDDSRLSQSLPAFQVIVDDHFRYYQFYAHSALAIAFTFVARQIAFEAASLPAAVAVGALETILLLASRDALRRYYTHGTQLLGTVADPERSSSMTNGKHPPKPLPKLRPVPKKPPKSQAKRKTRPEAKA